ncbi:energy transducer TonB [Flavitalea sp. BT771]|uniref:energy transducer TonB n=1 Tax=Flavitalea sp. BT771 TaxID=3063329 RepID=UPI0026E3E9F5|nr:energy transducer TonB [Flavitalea sp. BT771]MDO6431188.1 energy transducer TonB [Flavitalea sp. BT771]MDV6220095.1 energy transducer TonB [Flavitalea sp. BT771]
MEIQQISRADILDILFDGRNKDYGAYQLRKTYNKRLTRALAGMASICLLLIGGYTLAGRSHANVKPLDNPTDVILTDAPKEKEKVIIPPVVPKTPPPQVAMIRNTIPRVVPNDQVKPEDVPPPDDDMDKMKIGTANQKGADFDGTPGPPTNGTGAGAVIEAPKHDEEDTKIWTKVEIESFYPAGMPAWLRFVSKNFHVPEEAIANNAGGTVIVQFVVDKEGNVSDVHAVEGPQELRAEAERVIKKSGKWTAAVQNGAKVNSYKRQPITVKIDSE